MRQEKNLSGRPSKLKELLPEEDLSWNAVGREYADCIKLINCFKGLVGTCEICLGEGPIWGK